MPTWPTPEGRRTIGLELSTDLVTYLDNQSEYLGMSRVAYIRQLIVRDMERQGPVARIAQA